MSYRDDTDAAIERAAALERELERERDQRAQDAKRIAELERRVAQETARADEAEALLPPKLRPKVAIERADAPRQPAVRGRMDGVTIFAGGMVVAALIALVDGASFLFAAWGVTGLLLAATALYVRQRRSR